MSPAEEKRIADDLVRRDGFASFLRRTGVSDHEIVLEFQEQVEAEQRGEIPVVNYLDGRDE
jgi:hypothetical protein